jgi:glycosyltransferase involved in cell wall biosynthesis/O-antigen/teichoic acid export membrane protein
MLMQMSPPSSARSPASLPQVHVLVLSDRDWTHPQGGGTGANLYGQVSKLLAWGHRVSVVSSGYEGCKRFEKIGELELHRIGGRSTLFPRAIWRGWRGRLPDADVVLEVVNGITFLTPLWLRKPRVTLVHHIHRRHYVEELGRPGALAALLLETLPLKLLYRGSRFCTISDSTAKEVAEHGIPRTDVEVNYIGVEPDAFEPGERAVEPTLLYLGRLKRYKHIEVLLDVLERIPEAVLDIAGEGDHRERLELEIQRRGLRGRVRMHGHVSEERKVELLQRSWVNLTASSAEGWCLTVMEAAACCTPSAALAVGGLPESIAHGHSGLLAKDVEELACNTARILREPELRERLGRQALERARGFTWEATAERTLHMLVAERDAARQRQPLLRSMAASDTGRAAGLAAAVITTNVIALLFTIVFARVLGAGYGSLAALVSAFIILMVPGSALQIAVAREVSSAVAASDPDAGEGVRRWLGRLFLATAVVAGAAIPLRESLAAVIAVDEKWAAAAVPVTGMLWMLLSVERGALQGFQRYKAVGLSLVGEGSLRLLLAGMLVAAGLGVTGAFLGSAASIAAMVAVLAVPLLRRLPPASAPAGQARLWDLLAGAWAPVLGLTTLFLLQEVHVIVVKHEASESAAASWGVAAVAAKAIIWVAVGLGMYLLPEAARRSRSGEDARPILARTLVLIAAAAVPMVLIYALGAKPLLSAVFGSDKTQASGALPWLGLAMALLACAYLSVQYLLALGRSSFIWVLAAGALAEVLLLLAIGAELTQIAVALFALQLACAAAVLFISVAAGAPRSRSRQADPATVG